MNLKIKWRKKNVSEVIVEYAKYGGIGVKCKICGSKENLVTHHISYEKNKIIIVCRRCHGEIHRDKEHSFHPSDKKVRFSLFMEFFGKRSSMLRIIDFLIEKRPFDVTKEEVIKQTGVSRNSFFGSWEKIESYGLVKETRRIGRSKLYVLNEANETTQKLLGLELALIERAMNKTQRKVQVVPVS